MNANRPHFAAVLILLSLTAILVPSCGGPPSSARGHKSILVLGDSLTEGAGLPAGQVFPALLEGLIREKGFPGVTVTADGVGGDTSASAGPRLAARLARERHDILVLELGANDGLRGLPVESMEQNLSVAIEAAQAAGMKVVLAGMRVPRHHGADYKERFDAVYPRLAKRYGLVLVPFLLKGVAARPSYNLPDGIHPNARGHERVARTVLKHLEPLL